jgi:HD-GYP domain-containing protein (c-di-GMP phosphodiesterase class II)
MQLALPVFNPRAHRQVLLKANFKLDELSINRLMELGIHWIWLSYPSLDYLEKFISQDVLKAQGPVVEQITRTFEAVQKEATARLPYEQYTQSIGELVNQLLANPQTALFMGDLTSSDAPDQALMRHSSAVTYMSLLMGLKLQGYLVRQRKHVDPGQAKEVVQLGIGAMLHDVGLTLLDPAVRQAHEETGREDDAWRQHPVLGYQLVRGKVSPTAATVVLNHHQRYDGSGYGLPDTPGLQGERLHIFARIVSLADYFDECRHPVTGKHQPVVAVLRHLLEPQTLRKFDPQVVRALFTVAPPYPPGSMLKLSNGRWAAALDHNPANPCRPRVQLIPPPDAANPRSAPRDSSEETSSPETQDPADYAGQNLDLSEMEESLFVAEFEDQDVSHLNFKAPALLAESLSMSFM